MSVINADADSQLHDLEAEEARIMRELREMDEKANADKEAARVRAQTFRNDPEAALCTILLECEKEVRDAKGFIADDGPPLRILRVRFGETGPKNATFLSRPRGTGVDFTVPVTLKAYTDLIKNPIFLNQIRDKIKATKYLSSEDYLEDMRLLARNTAAFNKGPDLAWVVQHARYLLEAAEEAIQARRRDLYEVEQAIRNKPSNKIPSNHTTVLSAVGKRKRSATVAPDLTNGATRLNLPVGTLIEIYWDEYRKWFAATVVKRGPGPSEFDVVYTEDRSEQHIDFSQNPTMKWRMKTTRAAAKGRRAQEVPANNKRRKSSLPPAQNDAPIVVSGGVSTEDLDTIKDDIFSKVDDMRTSIMDTVESHMDKIDRILLRSDILQRVLLAVEDAQASMEDAVERMENRFSALEAKILDRSKSSRSDPVPEQLSQARKDNHHSEPTPMENIRPTEQVREDIDVATEPVKEDVPPPVESNVLESEVVDTANPPADQEPKSLDPEETNETSKEPNNSPLIKEEQSLQKKEGPDRSTKEDDPDSIVVVDIDGGDADRSPSPMQQSPVRETAVEEQPVEKDKDAEISEAVPEPSPQAQVPDIAEDSEKPPQVVEQSNEDVTEENVEKDVVDEVAEEAGADNATAKESKEPEEPPKPTEKAEEGDEESSSDSSSDSSESEESDNESNAKDNDKSDAEKSETSKEVIKFVESKQDDKMVDEVPVDTEPSPPEPQDEPMKPETPPEQEPDKPEPPSKTADEPIVPSPDKPAPERTSDAGSDNESEGD